MASNPYDNPGREKMCWKLQKLVTKQHLPDCHYCQEKDEKTFCHTAHPHFFKKMGECSYNIQSSFYLLPCISKIVEYKDLHLSPTRAPKSQLAVEHPSPGECWISPKKDAPCPKAKEKL